jgi:hypothetical protein
MRWMRRRRAEIRFQNGKRPKVFRADAAIDVSGTWSSPNPTGRALPSVSWFGGRQVPQLIDAT